jgi:hypothetical protein
MERIGVYVPPAEPIVRRHGMAVLMTAQIPGATQAMADGMEPLLNESAARRVSSFTPTARCLTAGASSR